MWIYRSAGAARPYGSFVRYEDTGHSANWDAIVTAGRLDDELIFAEWVSFDETDVALEQYVQQEADHV